jgi:hypothetical protein
MRTVQVIVMSLACLLGSTLAIRAQEAASDEKPYRMAVTDADAVQLAEAVRAHVYKSAPVGDSMEVFDRKKGQKVTLKFDKIIVEGEGNVVIAKNGYMAISVAFTEIAADKAQPDQYVLWFVMRKEKKTEQVVSYGTTQTETSLEEHWSVKDVIIRSVNGETMYTWSEDKDGKLVPTLPPQPQP